MDSPYQQQQQLGRQASLSRLHHDSLQQSFAHPQLSRQLSNSHLQADHLLQRAHSMDRNLDLIGGGGGGDFPMATRHNRLVRQESVMQPWMEEEEQMYSDRGSSKERGRDRDRDRNRDGERDKEDERVAQRQAQAQYLGLGLGLDISGSGERRLDPLRAAGPSQLQPPPGLQPYSQSQPQPQPGASGHPNPTSQQLPPGMAKVRSSSRHALPGQLAPLDALAAAPYLLKSKRLTSSYTFSNLSEDDSDDRSLPDMASHFLDFPLDNSGAASNYFPHATSTSTSPLIFAGGRLAAHQKVAALHRETPDSQAAESDEDNSILRVLGQHSLSYGSELSNAGAGAGAGGGGQMFYQHGHSQPGSSNSNSNSNSGQQAQQLFGRAVGGALDGPAGLSWSSSSRLMSGVYGVQDRDQGLGLGLGLGHRRLSRSQYPHTDELE